MKTNQIGYMLMTLAAVASAVAPVSAAEPPRLQVTVTSNQDGITPDAGLTLREAIALVNGSLSVDQLTADEKTQVQPLADGAEQYGGKARSQIRFNLSGDTKIQLSQELPPLQVPGTVVDGTSQPGYDASQSAATEVNLPTPRVEITPAGGVEILRGLTIVADGVQVKGLSLYGFNASHQRTALTPPADIFITHQLPPPDISKQRTPANFAPYYEDDVPPKDVVIAANWLGIPADGRMPTVLSAFGVSVFNGQGTTIQGNRIEHHEASGIITSVRSENLQVLSNAIVGNGLAGMPDAIRLEGLVGGSQIVGNLMCGNDGSGVFMFKPQGSVQVRENQIQFNGRRLRRAAIYVMGNEHRVENNRISHQAGAGVVVGSYPLSERNIIQNNRFDHLEGLSIDLNSQSDVGVQEFQTGDGPNPQRNSVNRRRDTGNGSVDAPQFLSPEFLVQDWTGAGNAVAIDGHAEPGATVELYRVAEAGSVYGPLSERLLAVQADDQGRFRAELTTLQAGDVISATATDSRYGTSEPAANAVVRRREQVAPALADSPGLSPQCLTPPQTTQTPPEVPPQIPARLRVPNNVHFALDQSTLSPISRRVLDKIAAVLQQYPTVVIELVGHTDTRASDDYNQALGLRRALSVRNYLIGLGISSARMTQRSLGERALQTRGQDRRSHAVNRRVEVIFLNLMGNPIEIDSQDNDLQIEP